MQFHLLSLSSTAPVCSDDDDADGVRSVGDTEVVLSDCCILDDVVDGGGGGANGSCTNALS